MPDTLDFEATQHDRRLQSARSLTLVVYVLYAIGMFSGLPALIGIFLNHLRLADVVGTVYSSHFSWQMRSFWWGLLWWIIGGITVWIGVGFVILGMVWIWQVYRLVRGFLNWSDGKPMPV
ncbi:MAG: hypothetical protein EOP39_12635 [Rubrivivax sp.]|nr:MAG: hypothetical protein EOP39_12635 [Rubrivivax sp.]